ncbi:MAG: hypothetical protein DPW16_11205 [Chloroflexi bacterium]|nr:hypothetical protein [Chloroflexota bacterium]
MFEPNVAKVLEKIEQSNLVLDIGGWARPFNRANFVLDIGPYETRGLFGFQGPEQEHFSEETWLIRDLCDREPYPFPDKYFDYVICSHTLEDIRDPIFVCSEINRIGKCGYIEVPSLVSELAMGIEHPLYAGRHHHRWLIEIEDNTILFTFKYHIIHFHRKYFIPKHYKRKLKPQDLVQALFWEDGFDVSEQILLESNEIDQYLMSCVRKYGDLHWRHNFEKTDWFARRLLALFR